MVGVDWLETRSAEKNLEFLGDKLTIFQHVVAKRVCIRRHVACRARHVVLPLCSDLVGPTGRAVHSSAFSKTSDMNTLKQAQGHKDNGLELVLHEEWLTVAGTLQHGEKRLRGILSMCINTSQEQSKKMKLNSLQ